MGFEDSISGADGVKLAAEGIWTGVTFVRSCQYLSMVVDTGSAVRHTRFQSNSADVEFGCMLRMDHGDQINDDGCFGADQRDGCWDGNCWCFSGRFGRVLVLWFGWLQGVSACIDIHA